MVCRRQIQWRIRWRNRVEYLFAFVGVAYVEYIFGCATKCWRLGTPRRGFDFFPLFSMCPTRFISEDRPGTCLRSSL